MTPVDRGEFGRIRDGLAGAAVEGPLIASELVDVLDARGVAVESAHRVATVLERRADASGRDRRRRAAVPPPAPRRLKRPQPAGDPVG